MSGLWRRGLRLEKKCPACGSRSSVAFSRKAFHTLHRCNSCDLRFRFPYEDEARSTKFYQKAYKQNGLTTDLPSEVELAELVRTGFRGGWQGFRRRHRLFPKSWLRKRGRILDYGANWGYASYQFLKAGYSTVSFEISKPRAAFGEKLSIDVETDLDKIDADFDICFSSHVLEHVPNPISALEAQIIRTRPGGVVIGITPNGSSARFVFNRNAYDKHWGRVHPVLLSDRFVAHVAKDRPYWVGSGEVFPSQINWDRKSSVVDLDMPQGNLFFCDSLLNLSAAGLMRSDCQCLLGSDSASARARLDSSEPMTARPIARSFI